MYGMRTRRCRAISRAAYTPIWRRYSANGRDDGPGRLGGGRDARDGEGVDSTVRGVPRQHSLSRAQ